MNLPKRHIVYAILCILLCHAGEIRATHVAGADLTYEYVSGNFYRFRLAYYRDCAGNMPVGSETMRIRSASCGYDYPVQLQLETGSGTEITFPCAGSASTCSGGSSFGVQKWTYSGVFQLPATCTDWIFSWQRCCRNCAITTTVHGNCNIDPLSEIYIEATLNNLNQPVNSSPVFSNDPVATMCLGQNFIYNHGVTDPDFDSLAYSVVASKIAPNTPVTYQPGYTALNPMSSTPPLSINAAGDLIMTPQQLEIGVMAVKVDEYRNGALIGSVTRDMQFVVQTCSNTLPVATGINGTADFDTTICPGTTLCFYIFTNDADAGQALSISAANPIPGSTFTNSGGSLPTASFCWTPTAAHARSTPWTFTVTVKDNACPTNGLQTYSFSITVPEIITSTAVDHVAGNIDLTVQGNTGPYIFTWSEGSATEDISGASPGIYIVTVCDVNGCCVNAQDTIKQLSNCTFNVSRTVKNATCHGACNGSIKLTPSGGTAPYSYTWSNGNTGNLADSLCAGTYYYTVTDANGCTWSCHSTICEPAMLTATCASVNTCQGGCNGEASVQVSGGKPPYTYLWNHGATGSSLTNLCAGVYTVTVTDASGCTQECTATVMSYQALNINIKSFSSTTAAACNGKVIAGVSQGMPGYQFNWSTGMFAENVSKDSICGLCPGAYNVIVSDANGCSIQSTANVGPFKHYGCGNGYVQNSARESFAEPVESSPLYANPNPFREDFSIETGNENPVEVYIYSLSGRLVENHMQIISGDRMGSDLPPGLYIAEIIQAGSKQILRISKM